MHQKTPKLIGHACVWFVEPQNSFTNEVIARFFKQDEDASESCLCEDGKRRNLWRCVDAFQFGQLERSLKGQSDLKFQVWRQKGSGRIEKWPGPNKGFRRQSRHRHLAGRVVRGSSLPMTQQPLFA